MIEPSVFPQHGGCTCGAVRYSMSTAPLFVHCCHCRWCQRESGSAFAVNALIEGDAVQLEAGLPERVEVPTHSGSGQTFSRCPECQVALWSTYNGLGQAVLFVRAGTLDRPDCVRPDIHIYTQSRMPWVVLPDDVPVMPEFYRRSQHWPQDSIDRLKAVRAR